MRELSYYVYAYIRDKDSKLGKAGTPYYIGKGRGRRAYQKHDVFVPPRNRIVFLEQNLTEIGALALERRYIAWWGRKFNKTGILMDVLDGGDGGYGVMSDLVKSKISASILSSDKYKQGMANRKKLLGLDNPSKRPEVRKKISEKRTGQIRLDMFGDTNPAKSIQVRKKISDRSKEFKYYSWMTDGVKNTQIKTRTIEEYNTKFVYLESIGFKKGRVL